MPESCCSPDQGWANAAIAAALGCALGTVRAWRHRFVRGGISALADRPRSGRPEVYGPGVRLAIVATVTSTPPAGRSVWTHQLIAAELAEVAISASQVGRILAELELAPHRVRGWLNRRDDEQFWTQAAAVCDAYLRPEPDTIVICIDEKTGIQAKYRKYPGVAGTPGRLARREFEYVRNGTVSIIAALQVTTGHVVIEPITRNDSVTFIGFLHHLHQCVDPSMKIHLVMDNGSSHTSRATRAPIAAHPRISVTYTPKHASWLDMAELWFSVLTRALLPRGEFTSRTDLAEKIIAFTIQYNRTAHPWNWTYDAHADHARYLARHTQPNDPAPQLAAATGQLPARSGCASGRLDDVRPGPRDRARPRAAGHGLPDRTRVCGGGA